jgi:hypothetical protein
MLSYENGRRAVLEIGRYLASTVGSAHGRQMDATGCRAWRKELQRNRSKSLDACRSEPAVFAAPFAASAIASLPRLIGSLRDPVLVCTALGGESFRAIFILAGCRLAQCVDGDGTQRYLQVLHGDSDRLDQMRTTMRMVESILYLRVLSYALNSSGGQKVPSTPHALASVASQGVSV